MNNPYSNPYVLSSRLRTTVTATTTAATVLGLAMDRGTDMATRGIIMGPTNKATTDTARTDMATAIPQAKMHVTVALA